MQWSEKLSEQTALTCPKKLQKYNIRNISYSGLLLVMDERTFPTPENVDQRDREAIGHARYQQDVQINNLLAKNSKR